MRFLHTADWHFGKTLEGFDRQPEQAQFVDELCQIADDERIDIVLVAGDVYQTANPSAAAEELFYEALERLADHGRRGIVVIAGNHDSPDRLCAASPLADRLGITLVGLPKDALQPSRLRQDVVHRVAAGPAWVEVAVPGANHTAVIAAVPYPSEARLMEVLAARADEDGLRDAYSQRVGALFRDLEAHFRPESANVAMSHLYIMGGMESDSERQIQLGGAYAVDPTHLPAGAQYVALGHLHRPQTVRGTAGPARYAGSPLAYSFSEAGQVKSVVVVDAEPGKAAAVREIPLSCGRSLVRWRAPEGLAQVYRWIDEGRDRQAWIDLEVTLDEALALPEVQRLRQAREGLVHIRPVFRAAPSEEGTAERASLSVAELFRRFYTQQTGGAEPDDALMRMFVELAFAAEEDDSQGEANEGEVKGLDSRLAGRGEPR